MKVKTVKRGWKLLQKYKLLLTILVFFSIVSAISNILGPVWIGTSIDQIVLHDTRHFIQSLWYLLLLYLCLFISNIVFVISLSKLVAKVTSFLREKLYDKLNTLHMSYFDQTAPGTIVTKFSFDIENIANGITQGISKLLLGTVTILLCVIIMVKINWIMASILILCGFLMLIISHFVVKHTSIFFQDREEKFSHLNGYIEEIFSAQKTIKDFAYETTASQDFEEKNKTLYTIGVKSQFYSALTNPSTRYVSNISYILIAISGIILSFLKQLSIGDISTFLMFTSLFTRPFNEITSVLSEIQISIASAEKIFYFLEQEEETDATLPSVIPTFIGNIECKNVSFSYDKTKPFIQHMNLIVHQGESVAIVGKTGSGKTTIVNLFMRFYEVDHGEILIDGINIKKLPRNVLRKQIGMVLQDTKLFTGTIKENIAYGKEDATNNQIKQAAKLAHADSFIERLPQGYDTFITHEGILSAGEVQLLTIARILLLKPPIVILDEATSNIDLITEANVQEALLKLIQGSTSFIIAHRLSTIVHADKILVIDNGNIVEQGTHTELLEKKGHYFALYHSQFKKEE